MLPIHQQSWLAERIGAKGETMRRSSTGHRGVGGVCCRAFRRFLLREQGGVTVEFVLWIPMLLAFMLLVADASLAFMRQASLLEVSRETARIVARHGLNAEAATRHAEARARIGTRTPEVSVDINADVTMVTVTILVEMRDLAPFGILETLQGNRVAIRTVHAIEPI
jgi:Flp pilus assembly protein TadG